jgi:hypothetical protein
MKMEDDSDEEMATVRRMTATGMTGRTRTMKDNPQQGGQMSTMATATQHPFPPLRATACRVDHGCDG